MSVDDILTELGPQFAKNCSGKPALQDSSATGTLTPAEQAILQIMDREPMHIDALAIASAIDVSSLLVHLFELELKAVIVQQPGQFFQKRIF